MCENVFSMTLKKHQWNQAILDESATLSDAIKTLDVAALRIVLVADNSGMLLGTVTDGDIRRAIIQEKSLSTAVGKAMNVNPVTARESDSLEVIRNLMKIHDVLQIPILDKQNRIVGVEVLQELIEGDLENSVLIMAGGFGKRLGTLTAHTPKPMLDLGGVPILERIIRDLSASGLKRIYIAIHYKGEVIK
jgi:CBS-domain-containing membrane protein